MSQTLDILRQGVWASLTGGWFYDPHQDTFCNIVHLYLWLFLLCTPLVTYVYFPSTVTTWCIYCLATTFVIAILKMVNMALHRLYDKAQAMSESNLKNNFYKDSKEVVGREEDCGIEMQVLSNDMPSGTSVDQAINEASEENSILSMENVNSVLDLKVDVHRKNSSESIEFMFFTQTMMAGNSGINKRDQTSLTNIGSSLPVTNSSSFSGKPSRSTGLDLNSKYLSVYPLNEDHIETTKIGAQPSSASLQYQQLRKSSEDGRKRRQRMRLERQCSLDAAAESSMISKLFRDQNPDNYTINNRNEIFLHHPHPQHHYAFAKSSSASTMVMIGGSGSGNIATTPSTNSQRNHISTTTQLTTTMNTSSLAQYHQQHQKQNQHNSANIRKVSRLQRHRSSETHEEQLKKYQRNLFLPIHREQQQQLQQHQQHQQHHQQMSSNVTGSSSGGNDKLDHQHHHRGLQSWVLGSSSDIYLDDNCTKSDFGIEKIENNPSHPDQIVLASEKSAYLMLHQQQLMHHHHHSHRSNNNRQHHHHHHNHYHPHHHHHHQQHTTMRKDSNSTMSALQLPVAAGSFNPKTTAGSSSSSMKKRRHSNATAMYKSNGGGGERASSVQPIVSVRRIKSAALEISCPHPSVSNLTPHPNSVEAISGQQQIKNPQSALLPPPSKCLVRNPHLNLCPKFGSFTGSGTIAFPSGGGLAPTTSNNGVEPVYPIVEQADEKCSLDTELGVSSIDSNNRLQGGCSTGNDVDDISPQGINDDDDLGHRDNSDVDDGDNDDSDDDDDDDDNDDDDDDEILEHRSVVQKNDNIELKRICDREGIHLDIDDDDDNDDDDIVDEDDDKNGGMEESSTTAGGGQLNDSNEAVSIDQTQHNTLDGVSRQQLFYTTESDSEGIDRPHTHSTDSETDKNGSRSPLLNCKNRSDKAVIVEMSGQKLQSQHSPSSPAPPPPPQPSKHQNLLPKSSNCIPQHLFDARLHSPRGEGDSGCPSSDCEQVSASSKDMLLAIDTKNSTSEPVLINENTQNNEELPVDNVHNSNSRQLEKSKKSAGTTAATGTTKNLGAIPKVVKYREINEGVSNSLPMTATDDCSCQSMPPMASAQNQLYKRKGTAVSGGSGSSNLGKSPSRASSSTSSRSFSAESFSNDIYKSYKDQWVVYDSNGAGAGAGGGGSGGGGGGGGVSGNSNVCDNFDQFCTDTNNGRSIGAIAAVSSSSSSAVNMSLSHHYQSYHDGVIQQLPSLPLSDRVMYLREKLRRSSKQISDPGGIANGRIDEYSHVCDVPATVFVGGNVVGTNSSLSSSAAAAAAAARNAATLSIQGLINDFENSSEHVRSSGGGVGGSGVGGGGVVISSSINGTNGGNGSGTTAILNVDGHIENYCDYWRPTCNLSTEKPIVSKRFYKYHFNFFGCREFKIEMDRLELLALFDRDINWFHVIFAVLLSMCVSFLGATILQLEYYHDLCAVLFCIVIAGSQYSLIKSVQPDAASPIHGFNKTVAYSRAIYFTLCAGLLLLFHEMTDEYAKNNETNANVKSTKLRFFGITYLPIELTQIILNSMCLLLLCFPIIFSLGLLPQINTFSMYLLEQIDMHVFGGNAAGSLAGAFLCVLRSMLATCLLYGPLYASLIEGRGTQSILFSVFCAMLIPISYHLSRSASDFSHLWALVKTNIVSTYRDDDDEMSATTTTPSNTSNVSDNKLETSTPKSDRNIVRAIAEDGVGAGGENIEMSYLEKIQSSSQPQTNDEIDRKSNKSKSLSMISNGKSNSMSHPTPTQPPTNSSLSQSQSQSQSIGIGVATKASPEQEIDDVVDEIDDEENTIEDETEGDKISSTTTNPDISTLTAGYVVAVAAVVDVPTNDNLAPTSVVPPLATTTTNTTTNTATTHIDSELPDPLPKKLQKTVILRLKNDLVVMIFLAVSIFSLHCSTVFTVLQPDLNIVLYSFAAVLGILLHYIIPQLRKHMPWLCFARPILRQHEFGQFEVSDAAKVMWFEKIYIYLSIIERNILFPLIAISALTADSKAIVDKFGGTWGPLIVAVCSLKFVRNAYSDPNNQYLILIFTVLSFKVDFATASETFLIDYFLVSLTFRKCCDFLLKLQFIVTYIAPWQITWGSAFHAFAQPFSVPHSAMLFLQAAISAVLSTPLNPFLGSAIFLTSYVRPIKFWERDYNTRRIDHSNTRLSSQLERDLGADDNNLNSIFYEHLTRSLQHSLCGDLLMGRWGNVNQGDCFVLASDYLNCLVHIIELGNGLCTFQMRGLEFRGTYCQQREVEAITEGVEDNDGCCCCDPGHLPRMLSANAMFSTRWLAWQVIAAQYVLEGYSISDNLASATLQVFEYRKVLITYYIKSIVYFVVRNPKLDEWLESDAIQDALQHTLSRQFVDLDPIFNYNLDEDFDFRALGITRSSYCSVYLSWIHFCYEKRKTGGNITPAGPGGNNASTVIKANTAPIVSQPIVKREIIPPNRCIVSTRSRAVSTPASIELNGRYTLRTNITKSMTTTAATTTTTTARAKGGSRILLKDDSPPAYGSGMDVGGGGGGDNVLRKSIERNPILPKDSPIVSLCLALGLLGRRSLATASHSSLSGVEFFLHGLHALFKGDFRITSPRDEWVFADMELLHGVVAPAVKMALKLQQDHISNPDEYLDPEALYTAIQSYSKDLVISHEADPVWRSAVLRGAPNLLALRHVMEDGSDEYRIIRLTKRFLSFRVIKLNRECVRGLWAGQQQELIYLRNRNPERGSIQNAKQALRNIINSSCDQPIGYPIYVSPLTTSYSDTNVQLCKVIGGAITLESIKDTILSWWHRARERCRQGCSSGSAIESNMCVDELPNVLPAYFSPSSVGILGGSSGVISSCAVTGVIGGNLIYGSQNLSVSGTRSSLVGMNKPTSSTLLAGLLNRERENVEREAMRECRIVRKGAFSIKGDRERRATLPTTSHGGVRDPRGDGGGCGESSNEPSPQNLEKDKIAKTNSDFRNFDGVYDYAEGNNSGQTYSKMSISSGNLGIASIITTPGDYPRKYKGPISVFTTGDQSLTKSEESVTTLFSPPAVLNKKVVIVDELEVYDCLNLGRSYDVIWPNEKMRTSGGRLAWHGKNWSPTVGMIGNVVHYWSPQHSDQRYRTRVSRTVYLVEIGENYVPVGERGISEYNTNTHVYNKSENDEKPTTSQIKSIDEDSLNNLKFLEAPPAEAAAVAAAAREAILNDMLTIRTTTPGRSALCAVSSSSSDDGDDYVDHDGNDNEDDEIRRTILNMMMMSQNINEIDDDVDYDDHDDKEINMAAEIIEIEEIDCDDKSRSRPQTPTPTTQNSSSVIVSNDQQRTTSNFELKTVEMSSSEV